MLSSEESNLDLVVGSDHALHVTADAEDDALTAYVQEHLQYTSSDPAVVSVDQYGRLHVNAEGDAIITASFGESSVSVQIHVGSGGASGTGSAAGEGTAPSRGGGSAERRDGEVVPERDNLSVCFADSSPERGAFGYASHFCGKSRARTCKRGTHVIN